MLISSIVQKTLFPLVAIALLTVFTIPVMATDKQPVPEEPKIEHAEALPPVPDTPEEPTDEVTIDSESPESAPEVKPDTVPSEPEQETTDIQINDTTQLPQDATALMLECLQDIRTCMSIIVYIIFPLISAIALIKWFIVRPFNNYVS